MQFFTDLNAQQTFRPSRAFQPFQLQEQVLELLANATNELAAGGDYERIVNFIATLLVKDFATWCTIDLVQENGSIERVTAAHRYPEMTELVKRIQSRYPANPKAERGVYKVIREEKSILVPHYSDQDWADRADTPEHLELILRLGSSSFIIVPLIARNTVVGAIMLLTGERAFGESDLKVAEQLAGWIAMVVDNISMFRKMKTTLMALETTQSQLLQSSKMAALGVISAGIAHEINNPLAVIRLTSDRIKNKMNNKELDLDFERLQAGIDRIVRIITGVSDFSRVSEPALSPVDLSNVLSNSVSFVQEQARSAKVKIELVSHHSGIIVNGSASRLEQVIVNILANAIDSIVEKGSEGLIRVGLWKDGSSARLHIEDNGAGIDPDHQSRVFEPFFTTKGSRGTGLGLSISHGIIQDHDGEIIMSSEVGKGSRVNIEIPLLLD